MPNKNALIIVIVVIAAVAGATLVGAIIVGSAANGTQQSQEIAVGATVTNFGEALQNVPLLAPDASSTIANLYSPYIAPELLKQWVADPSSAPGRVAASPWPDHIQITSVTPQGIGYVVTGDIVFLTSAADESTTSISMHLENVKGGWFIDEFQGQQNSGS